MIFDKKLVKFEEFKDFDAENENTIYGDKTI
jgi:hypothetical protein